MSIQSFNPPIRTLMGPGPTDVHPRILGALGRPTIGHLDPSFVAMMDDIKDLLRYAFRTDNALTMPISAPGSAGMEACFVNLVEPGDKVVICINGVFGLRMKENVERSGGVAIVVDDIWGRALDPQRLEDTLRANPDAKIVALVHAETSTGARSDVKTLAEVAHRHDCLTIVDAVTALGGCELQVDAWGVDAVYAGTQKCLSCPPGLAPVSFNERALEKVHGRRSKVQSWFLDLNLIVRGRLLQEYGLEIGAGLGEFAGKVWRIGLMGYSSRAPNILLCVGALGNILNSLGVSADTGAALSGVQNALSV